MHAVEMSGLGLVSRFYALS